MILDFPSSHMGAVNNVNDPLSRAVLEPGTEILSALFAEDYIQVYPPTLGLAPTLLPSATLSVTEYNKE